MVVIAPPDEVPVVAPDGEGATRTGLRITGLGEVIALVAEAAP